MDERQGIIPSYLLTRLAQSARFPEAAQAARTVTSMPRQ